ncbi:MAG: HAD family hydrolase [Elusimicrobiota bacterium]
MMIGIDIDDTITALPEFFKELTVSFTAKGHKIHIITSRTDNAEVRKITRAELQELGIKFDFLYFLPSYSTAKELCPHLELDWFQKYLWQKADYCLKNDISIYFDDDIKVVELFQKYSPEITVLQISAKEAQCSY